MIMLESCLPVANVPWSTDMFTVVHTGQGRALMSDHLAGGGRFATADRVRETVVLTRDRLGLNKLYFAIHPDRGVVAANYLADLVRTGIPFEAIYAVPAGTAAVVDLHARTIRLNRHHLLPPSPVAAEPRRHLAQARDRLRQHIEAAAAAHPYATVAVCLSGGLDSGLIAALVRAHFANVVAYTYAFDDHTGQLSPDALAAERLAHWLDIPFRLVTADADKVFTVLPRAYRNGQDWRDFNVHCAIVNDILAEAIAADLAATDGPVLVFTGDLMNELLGDYTPIRYREQDFYPLPNVPPEQARTSLVRGLQCGDREVGVFAAHGLVAVQPYGQIADELLQVPATLPKPEIIRALADTLLPAESYDRPKARAQIGSPTATTGILPLLVDSGRVGNRLEHEFCAAIDAPQPQSLRGRIRAGVYRFPSRFPMETT
jgi:asparagine synthetase B (glutamine-hydrolysing)